MGMQGVYTANGLGLFDTDAKDAMWRDAPHPLLVSRLRGFGEIIDFNSWSPDEWTETLVSGGAGTSTVALTDREGGWVRVDCAADENDGGQAQRDKSTFRLASTNSLWIDFRIDLTEEVTQSDCFVGLSITNTTIIGSERVDIAQWHTDDGDANWDFSVAKSSTETDANTETTAVLDTPIILGFTWDGTTLYPYYDGTRGTAITTNIPDDVDLELSFGYLNGAGSEANEAMDLDWIRYVSLFDRT